MAETSLSGVRLLTAPGQVMTPRPASEALVAAAVARIAGRPLRVVDVGTGSGAIAIAIASAVPAAEVRATDTSRAAVELARANVRRSGLEGRIRVHQADLLDGVPGPLDLVVANLPYLPVSAAAASADLAAEPSDAVFAPGDGLDPYRRLLSASAERLAHDGAVILQFHRRVLQAARAELWSLRAELERHARTAVPLAAAA